MMNQTIKTVKFYPPHKNPVVFRVNEHDYDGILYLANTDMDALLQRIDYMYSNDETFGILQTADKEDYEYDLTIRKFMGPSSMRSEVGPGSPIEKESYSKYESSLQMRKTLSVFWSM